MFQSSVTSPLRAQMEHVLVKDMRLADVDLFDPKVYETNGVPHEAMQVLRREAPVYFHPEPGGRGFWAVTKYDDVAAIGKDPQTFSSFRGGTNIQDYPPDNMSTIQLLMLNMEPPQHNKFRRLASKGFTPRMVAAMEP